MNYIANIEKAWKLFYDGFTKIVDKHAPLRKYRVKAQNNAWFTSDLSNLLHKHNVPRAKAWRTSLDSDGLFSGNCAMDAQLQLEKQEFPHWNLKESKQSLEILED